MAAPTPYLIIGHGIEDVLDTSRKPLPPGVTIVTLTQCGNSTQFEEVCPFMKAFQDPTNDVFLRDPARYKRELEAKVGLKIRVSRPGDMYPFYVVRYLADFVAPPGKVNIVKSGIYQYPIKPETDIIAKWKKPYEAGICETFFLEADISENADPEVIKEVYRDAAYTPPLPADVSKFSYKDLGKIMTEPFDEAIAALPKPAVFYYVICRAPFAQDPPKNIYRTAPHMFARKTIPGADELTAEIKILSLNYTNVQTDPKNKYTNLDYVDFPGVPELQRFKKNPVEAAKEPALKGLLDSIVPIQTRNTFEEFRDVLSKIELVKAFDANQITDPVLKQKFKEYQAAFTNPRYYNPKKHNYVTLMGRRRAESNAQQNALEAELNAIARASAKKKSTAKILAEAMAAAMRGASGHGGRRKITRRCRKKSKKRKTRS